MRMTDRGSLAQLVEERLGRAVGSLYETLERNRVTRFPWAVIQTFSAGQGALLAGSMAYFTFLSLLPLLMIGSFVLGTILQGNDAAQDALVRAVRQIFPGIAAGKILSQLIASRVVFGVLGLITVAYSGSGFVGALTACLNRMWEVSTGRNPVGQKILNFLVVLMLSVILIGSVGLTLWVAYLTRITIGETAGLAQRLEFFASPIALFIVLLLLYRLLPARTMSWGSQIPGAIAGALAIEILKRAFAFWAEHSAGVSALPRTLLSVVLLLVWLGFFGQIILYGAAINVV
ncbi:MAG: YihY/virulence factor BrkB family protein, partial [Chloroflexota bacterium]|nr:YihY/virulence factor BrkB family protein [Chloroflexota bacterium]